MRRQPETGQKGHVEEENLCRGDVKEGRYPKRASLTTSWKPREGNFIQEGEEIVVKASDQSTGSPETLGSE